MRRTWSLFLIPAVVLVCLVLPSASPAADEAEVPEAFAAQKCNLCHSVDSHGVERRSKSEKMKGPDLSGVGADHDAAWIEGWLRQKESKDGETHQREFKGSDEELKALVDWLATLQGEGAS